MKSLLKTVYYSKGKTNVPDNQVFKSSGQIEIIFDPNKQLFLIKGVSDPINAREFYADAITWLVSYAKEPLKYQNLLVELEYFNTASALFLLRLFKFWQKIDPTNHITWVYGEEDEFLKQSGSEYQEILNERFYLKAVTASSQSADMSLAS